MHIQSQWINDLQPQPRTTLMREYLLFSMHYAGGT